MFQSSRKFIALAVLVVVGTTVLSPHFAWEATTPDEHCSAQASAVATGVARITDGKLPLFEHHTDHVCGCHMFSHLPIQASAYHSPHFPKLADVFSSEVKSLHYSHDPETFDRPPKSSLA